MIEIDLSKQQALDSDPKSKTTNPSGASIE